VPQASGGGVDYFHMLKWLARLFTDGAEAATGSTPTVARIRDAEANDAKERDTPSQPEPVKPLRAGDAEFLAGLVEPPPCDADQLTNEEVAAVLSHERTSWGNQAPPVKPEDVIARRQ